jgi:Skp family chaperone for outer membrane proteins
MTWIIVIASLFALLILAEEVINYFLRTKVIEHHPKAKRSEGKMKSLFHKVKLKLTHTQ